MEYTGNTSDFRQKNMNKILGIKTKRRDER